MGFSAPAAPGAGIKWEEHNGKLFVIEALEVVTGIATNYGSSDAVRANVHIITGPGTSDDYLDTLIFPKVLQGQVKGKIGTGDSSYGRLTQGTAKPGQSAPWMIAEPTADDLDKVLAWDAARSKAQYAAPAAAAAPAQAAPAAAPATSAAPF